MKPQFNPRLEQAGTCKDNYKMGKKLGSGAFSDVLQATSTKGGEVVAVKQIKKSNPILDHEALKREVSSTLSYKVMQIPGTRRCWPDARPDGSMPS